MQSNVLRLVRDDEVEYQQDDAVFDDGDGGDGGGLWEIGRRVKAIDESTLMEVMTCAFDLGDEEVQLLYVLDEPAFWRRIASLAAPTTD